MTFWQGRRVLITGQTGFKGAWLAHWLTLRGARVFGLALAPDTDPALFTQLDLANRIDHRLGDIRDAAVVARAVDHAAPEVVFHLAAQPLVRRSYRDPVDTFATNVMGTVHVLDALRGATSPVQAVMITTDKVYHNREWVHAYRETDRLGGHDPYSASKAACEIAIESYRKSFLAGSPVKIAVARAGNVIGGGDRAEDRILPDIIRAAMTGQPLLLRNPHALRPWQHVLDPLAGYLHLAEALATGQPGAEEAFNFGPDAADQRRVGDLLTEAQRHWPLDWVDGSDPAAVHEAGLLALSTDKARAVLGWRPRWDFATSVARTVAWYRAVDQQGASALARTSADIAAFEEAGA